MLYSDFKLMATLSEQLQLILNMVLHLNGLFKKKNQTTSFCIQIIFSWRFLNLDLNWFEKIASLGKYVKGRMPLHLP